MDWFSLCQWTVIVPGNSVEFIMVRHAAWQNASSTFKAFTDQYSISYSGYAQKTKTQIRDEPKIKIPINWTFDL